MPQTPKPSSFALAIVQGLKNRLRDADRRDDLVLSHRIPVVSLVGGTPLVYTVDVTPGREGRYLATCREFPKFYVAGRTEYEVLRKAELEIAQQLKASRPPSP